MSRISSFSLLEVFFLMHPRIPLDMGSCSVSENILFLARPHERACLLPPVSPWPGDITHEHHHHTYGRRDDCQPQLHREATPQPGACRATSAVRRSAWVEDWHSWSSNSNSCWGTSSVACRNHTWGSVRYLDQRWRGLAPFWVNFCTNCSLFSCTQMVT